MVHARRAALIATAAASALTLAACNNQAVLPEEAGYGPNPTLPEPKSPWFPTIKIADAVGWKSGEKPIAAGGGQVTAFATGLQHPRWLYELPNGDILVAESDAPPKPEDKSGGVRGWVQGLFMKKAGSKTPSANRITLLRDRDGDGVAETKSVFLENLTSPFGMALVGNQLYIANADADGARAPISPARRSSTAPRPVRVAELPAGRNHHWTKSMVASEDGSRNSMSASAPTPMSARNGMAEGGETALRRSWKSTRRAGATQVFASRAAQPGRHRLEPR